MNILLQHWDGELDALGRLSHANMRQYAASLGAEYRLLRGKAFHPLLSAPCQKLAMLGEEFDAYDWVVMVDMDMFAVTGEDVFQVDGTGLFSEQTKVVFARFRRKFPNHTDERFAYWGGAIYRLSRERRRALREHIREEDLLRFSGYQNHEDEGIMHRLACFARIPQDRMPDRWCQCSFLPHPERAAMIHIRTKITPNGPKRTKLENYVSLTDQGIFRPPC